MTGHIQIFRPTPHSSIVLELIFKLLGSGELVWHFLQVRPSFFTTLWLVLEQCVLPVVAAEFRLWASLPKAATNILACAMMKTHTLMKNMSHMVASEFGTGGDKKVLCKCSLEILQKPWYIGYRFRLKLKCYSFCGIPTLSQLRAFRE